MNEFTMIPEEDEMQPGFIRVIVICYVTQNDGI